MPAETAGVGTGAQDFVDSVQDAKAVLRELVVKILTLILPELDEETLLLIPCHLISSWGRSMPDSGQKYCMDAFLFLFFLTGRLCLVIFNFKACLGPLGGCDTVLSSGNGTGKTLVLILLLILRPDDISLLIVPLKRLQLVQVPNSSVVVHVLAQLL